MNGHGWGMGWGWIIALLILAALIWFIFRMVNQQNRSQDRSSQTPLDILKERYAKGEIDKDEYEERKNNLS
ncbi:MAG: SHOCT domain-containing protein [Perlabentimonas sp.]